MFFAIVGNALWICGGVSGQLTEGLADNFHLRWKFILRIRKAHPHDLVEMLL